MVENAGAEVWHCVVKFMRGCGVVEARKRYIDGAIYGCW